MTEADNPIAPRVATPSRFTNAGDFGFLPEATGLANATALQRAVDQGGTIIVSQPGTYDLAQTIYLGSHTSLEFGGGVFVRKVDEQGPFTQVFLNKGALTRTYDQGISLCGLQLITNGMDVCTHEVYGMRGHVGFFYIKDLRIERFRCLDFGATQFCIQVCTFEDIIIDDVIIKGDKDGVHLGPGQRFTIRNGVFQTYDDAIALNAQDYSNANPEQGWIENGVVENCHDLNAVNPIGFFCRLLGGGWVDWHEGMQIQQSDTVAHAGLLYRVQGASDGKSYTSISPPTHTQGQTVLDGIIWGMVQTDDTRTAGVRNVVFRDIFLSKPRVPFAILFANHKYNRSYYPNAPVPLQEQITFENIHVDHDQPVAFMEIAAPVEDLTIAHSSLRNNSIGFRDTDNPTLKGYGKTNINLIGCTFRHAGSMDLVINDVANKVIRVQTTASVALHDDFTAHVIRGKGTIHVSSDLPGLGKE